MLLNLSFEEMRVACVHHLKEAADAENLRSVFEGRIIKDATQ